MLYSLLIVLIAVFFLYKNFDKTVVAFALWIPVLNNFVLTNYKVSGLISLFIFLGLSIRVMQKEIDLRKFPFLNAFILLFISYFLSSIIGNRLKLGDISLLLNIFCVPIALFYAINRMPDLWSFLSKNIFVFVIILVGVGLIELSLAFNPVIYWLQDAGIAEYEEVREDYIRYGMYRCQSLTVWCSTYGVTCGFLLLLLLLLKNFQIKILPSIWLYAIMVLLGVGLISCGTRSVYVAFCISLMAYLIQISKKGKQIVTAALLVFVIYLFNREAFDQIIDSFVNAEDTQGSSVELREMQFNAAYNEFIKSPIFGNGIGAINDLKEKSNEILGAESFIFYALVERGFLGLLLSINLLYQVIKYLFRIRMPLLVFIPVGVAIGKISSLFPDIEETYYFFYLFILIRACYEYKNSAVTQLTCKYS